MRQQEVLDKAVALSQRDTRILMEELPEIREVLSGLLKLYDKRDRKVASLNSRLHYFKRKHGEAEVRETSPRHLRSVG